MQKTEDWINFKVTRWPYLLMGIVSMLFAGIIYAWSILKAPLAQSFGWTASDLALNFTVTMCFFCIGGVLSGFLSKRTSPKISVVIGAVMVSCGFIIASRMSGVNITTLYLSYGCMGGLGIGMAYNAIIATTNAWFPDKRGMCSGALMMGFGASTLVLGNIAGAMINLKIIGWRGTYLALGVAIGVVLLLTGIILKLPSADMQFPEPKLRRNAKIVEDFEPRDYTTGEMVRRLTFWRFFLFSISVSAVGSTVISFAKDLAMSVGAAAALATTLVGVLSVCNGLGRIVCGLLFDTMGRRRTMLIASIITIVSAAVTLSAVLSHSLGVVICGLCLTGMSYGFSPTISSAFTSSFYGSKYFAINFSISNMMLIPASFTATLAGILLTATGSYVIPCTILVVFAVASLLLCLSIKRP